MPHDHQETFLGSILRTSPADRRFGGQGGWIWVMRHAPSSAPGFRWTSRWDIIGAQTQEHTPMSSAPNPGERGRFSSRRKTAAVLRLLRGEDLELVSRELG